VLLTQAGEQLLQHAQKILQEMESAREMLRRLGKQMVLNSVIEIGSMEATKELVRSRPRREHPRAVDYAGGNRRRLARGAAAGPAQIATPLGRSSLARQTAESGRRN